MPDAQPDDKLLDLAQQILDIFEASDASDAEAVGAACFAIAMIATDYPKDKQEDLLSGTLKSVRLFMAGINETMESKRPATARH